MRSHPGDLELTTLGVERCGLPPGARILDIGCGDGASLAALRADYRVLGVDPIPPTRDVGLGVAAARGQALPLVNATCDAVLVECVLSTQPDWPAILAEAARVLVPGGWLVVSDLYTRDGISSSGRGFYPGLCARDGLTDELARRGFDLVSWEDVSPVLREPRCWSHCLHEEQAGGALDVFLAISRLPLGYYLATARKTVARRTTPV